MRLNQAIHRVHYRIARSRKQIQRLTKYQCRSASTSGSNLSNRRASTVLAKNLYAVFERFSPLGKQPSRHPASWFSSGMSCVEPLLYEDFLNIGLARRQIFSSRKSHGAVLALKCFAASFVLKRKWRKIIILTSPDRQRNRLPFYLIPRLQSSLTTYLHFRSTTEDFLQSLPTNTVATT